ncbi:MAG: patatin-like phospholipase family protein [Gallionella sp.]
MKIVLQIDGGGIRGVTPAMVLAALETRLKEHNPEFRLRDMLSLCCGTSTGAIMAAMVCAGVDAKDIQQFYEVDGVDLFQNGKNPWFTRLIKAKYKRPLFVDKFEQILAESSVLAKASTTLGDLPSRLVFMATAYNLSSYRTHFIKSDDKDDKVRFLKDVIAWSGLSAAYFFGKINVPNYSWVFSDSGTPAKTGEREGAIFQDGGQGSQNCTLGFALTEILARGWDNEKVIIISLGTGTKTSVENYKDASKTSEIGQAIKYLLNQARKESAPVQILAARYIELSRPNIKTFRLDYESDKDYSLDDCKSMDYYKEQARNIIRSNVFDNLAANISSEHWCLPTDPARVGISTFGG